ncbi:MAG: aminomethyl-transferring glycine dehydrogenase subunit GcvPB [Acidobacteriota bacterium]|nr:aminomethyl-transferring glycine dehydrogenase subunit GcvPB [Blastocatellia bacterium]MDW8411867.1 aminomethyl-transferring glycine dehydrogenase subunit GcvPB [Acidobacteriota bacterium]
MEKIKKVSRHITQNEPLLFERSRPGAVGYKLPPLDVPAIEPQEVIGSKLLRNDDLEGLPELSEPDVVRHFIRLSTWNYATDLGMFPLGSCTMKYNPKINEWAARLEGFTESHPMAPESAVQGSLEIIYLAQELLKEITGMAAVTVQPAAGAHGEMTGIMMIRAHLEKQGNARKKVLIPDSAHGTNPASAVICGYAVETIPSDKRGLTDLAELEKRMDDTVAGLMLTNPNTLGLFEENIEQICKLVHERGGLVYMDGANMNALCGITRPGDMGVDVLHMNLHKTMSTPHGGGGPGAGPVAVSATLEPYLPVPLVVKQGEQFRFDYDRPDSIGRVKAFYGNFLVLVRAVCYILSLGPDGLKLNTEAAVLNANYLAHHLRNTYEIPYDGKIMHEVVFSDKNQLKYGVRNGDIAKRLIDYGFHPPTMSFPLIVPGALMVEPTESESRQELDLFIDAMKSIAREAEENPDLVKNAPYSTRIGRLDEVSAARNPILRWHPSQE